MTEFEKAKARVEYQMTFAKAPREFHESGIIGPRIPSSRGEGDADGSWAQEWDEGNEGEYIVQFFVGAISEAIHETCEWFKVDGELLVDPHKPGRTLLPLMEQFARRLLAEGR